MAHYWSSVTLYFISIPFDFYFMTKMIYNMVHWTTDQIYQNLAKMRTCKGDRKNVYILFFAEINSGDSIKKVFIESVIQADERRGQTVT